MSSGRNAAQWFLHQFPSLSFLHRLNKKNRDMLLKPEVDNLKDIKGEFNYEKSI
jgi:hypothetical protein